MVGGDVVFTHIFYDISLLKKFKRHFLLRVLSVLHTDNYRMLSGSCYI